MATLLRPFLHDRFLHLLVVLGVVLACFAPFKSAELVTAVDWNTIITLCGLLMLTKGIELSGYFEVLGRRLIHRFQRERTLALFMVTGAALLSTFLTNDVALFILVPLTLTLRKFSSLPVSRLIIFEALAVNAGSLLTPIGNPQNILLWSHGQLGFAGFILQMLPLAALTLASLWLLTWFSFSKKQIQRHAVDEASGWQRRLLLISVAMYGVFIVALELQLAQWALLLLLAVFLCIARRVLLSIDWSLLAVFIAMFIDVFFLTRLPVLQEPLQHISQLGDGGRYLLAIGLSQIISNVPATILLLNSLPASTLLAWAVNIGGFGLLPGSLANLIALRMAKDRRIWWHFHLFSIPMLLWSMALAWGLFLLINAA
ncbi:SLC13 family permease [Winslowiella iniecta]|uniref:Membrane protein n=1 Tax=Winslowiella iniecta TaxID=1560201 RepID=A0A0L7TBT3_9GAMM|nr:SLC13 family permease [Winslowiella iniecta]KOC92822.1 membrane protein [Winslowiella iniecta]KOC95259.1 membrane protein [Winslowiella iniecta]